MSPSGIRKLLRFSHVFGGGIVGTYLYSPWGTNPTFTMVTLYLVVPFLGLSSLAMWQQAKLTRFLQRNGRKVRT